MSIFQCQKCGKLHKKEIKYDIEGDLFTSLRCPICKMLTPHLWCDNEDNIYKLFNLNVDPRYYNK